MKLLYIVCINLSLVCAEYDPATHNGIEHCDLNIGVCEGEKKTIDLKTQKYLFYDVHPSEGFNLRRDVYMRFAILLAETQEGGEKMNWHLVLPPWYNLYHWKSETYRDPPKPWNMFFDVTSLKSYAPVLEMHEVMQNTGLYGLRLDSLYILQNYDDPFENGEFRDKWNVVGPCRYEGNLGYQNITAKQITCVQFQGSITQLWEIIETQPKDKKVLFSHGEIPLHSSYGTKTYWKCRKSMQFKPDLVKAATSYIVKKLNCAKTKCTNYLAIHWRRQDFNSASRSTSAKSTAKQIDQTIKKKSLPIQDIFIASDGTNTELKRLKSELKTLGYKAHYYLPDVSKFVDGQIAIIEQIICSRSAYFIGTHESTFSYRIQEEREILGFDSDTTFNRLCPDIGECEKPSRWTIIH